VRKPKKVTGRGHVTPEQLVAVPAPRSSSQFQPKEKYMIPDGNLDLAREGKHWKW
jgi:hypothetical protein